MTTQLANLSPPVMITKVFDPTEVNYTPGERSLIAWITTDAMDHEKDVVVAGGVDTRSAFLGETPETGNPVVMAFHDYGRWPIGICKWIKVKKGPKFKGLVAETVFDETPDSEIVWQKVKQRTVRGISVGFIEPDDFKPGEWGPPTPQEIALNPHWKGARRIIRRCKLIEYSIVPIPMNPTCLAISVSKGMHPPVFTLSEETMPAAVSRGRTAGSGASTKSISTNFDLARKSFDADEPVVATSADARVMIGLWLPGETAAQISVDGGEPGEDLHLTLCYLGRLLEIGTNAVDRVKRICQEIAAFCPVLVGKIAGVGRFSASDTSDGMDVVYASADIPELAECRQRLAMVLEGYGIAYSKAHGFTPHITLAYIEPDADSPVSRISPASVVFDKLCLVIDNEKTFYPFNSAAMAWGYPVSYRANSEIENKCMDTVKDEDEGGDEETMSIKPDMHVKCKGGCGTVHAVHMSGSHAVDSEDEDEGEVDASDTSPVAKVLMHAAGRDGKCMSTARIKSVPCAECTPWDEYGTAQPKGTTVPLPKPYNDSTPNPDPESLDTSDGEVQPESTFRRGDAVSIDGDGHKGIGKVVSVHKDGDFVPDVDQHVMGTNDSPAAKVHRYKAMGDGYAKTGVYTGHSCKSLKVIPGGLPVPTKKTAVASATKTAPAPTPTPPSDPPISGGMTDDERIAEATAKVIATLNPVGIGEAIQEQFKRHLGCP